LLYHLLFICFIIYQVGFGVRDLLPYLSRGGLVFKAHRLCVSLNSTRESNKEEEDISAAETLHSYISSGQGLDLNALSREHGTYKTVKVRFWPWLSEKKLDTV